MGERVLGDTNSGSFVGYHNNIPQTQKKKKKKKETGVSTKVPCSACFYPWTSLLKKISYTFRL